MTVCFFPRLSLSLTSFRPSAVFVLRVKSGALEPTGMGMGLWFKQSVEVEGRKDYKIRTRLDPVANRFSIFDAPARARPNMPTLPMSLLDDLRWPGLFWSLKYLGHGHGGGSNLGDG